MEQTELETNTPNKKELREKRPKHKQLKTQQINKLQ